MCENIFEIILAFATGNNSGLRRRAETAGFEVFDLGDCGDCLFGAVNDQLHQEGRLTSTTHELRQHMVEHLQDHDTLVCKILF